MFIITKEKLEESKNKRATRFVNKSSILKKQDKPVDAIIHDAVIARRLLINGKPLELRLSSAHDNVGAAIETELGKDYGNIILQDYSKSPLDNLRSILNHAITKNGGSDNDKISNKFSKDSMNIYVKDNKLYYECTTQNLMLHKPDIFPGSVSCIYIYDATVKAFVLDHIKCSNSVLHDMIVKNKFDARISRETAAIEEEQNNGTMLEQPEYNNNVLHEMIFKDNFKTEKEKVLKEAKIFLHGLAEAKKLIEIHAKPIIKNSSHPLVVFYKTISTAIDILTEKYEERADVSAELAKQKKFCKDAFNQVVKHTVFTYLRPLLNNLAALLGYKLPYPNIHMGADVSIGKLIEVNNTINSTPKPGR